MPRLDGLVAPVTGAGAESLAAEITQAGGRLPEDGRGGGMVRVPRLRRCRALTGQVLCVTVIP